MAIDITGTIKLIDSLTGELTSYSPITEFEGGGEVVTDSDVDGAVIRKSGGVYYKRNFTGPIKLDWYGIENNQDITTILNASTRLAGLLGVPLEFPKGNFTISSTITINYPTHIIGNEADIFFNASGSTGFAFRGDISTGITVTSDINAGDLTINVASNTTLTDAEYIYISTDENYNLIDGRDYKKGEICKVESTTDTTVTLYKGVEFDYSSANTLTIQKLTMVKGVQIDGLNIHGLGGTSALLRFYQCDGVLVTNSRISLAEVGMELIYSVNCNISNNYFNEIITDGTGYGVAVGGASRDVTITDNNIQRCRHGVTTTGYTGVVMDMIVANNTVNDTTSTALDSHGNGRHLLFSNNTIRNCGRGVASRSPFSKISNNKIYNCEYGVLCDESGSIGLQVNDNEINNVTATGISISKRVGDTMSEINNSIIVRGNLVNYVPNGGGIALNNVLCRVVDVSGNTVIDSKFSAITVNAAEMLTVMNNTIYSTLSTSGNYAINLTGINTYTGTLPLGSTCVIQGNNISRFYYGISATTFDKLVDLNNTINVTTTAQRRAFTGITTLYGQHGGSTTFTGNGATTSFNIAHGFLSVPHYVTVTPTSTPTDYYITKSAANIVVHFITAPAADSINTFDWMATVTFT